MKKFLLIFTFLGITFQAHAVVLTDTVSLGTIGDSDSVPGVPFTFDLGSALSSITDVTFSFNPCDTSAPGCNDTIGNAEDIILQLGPDNFTIGNAGVGNPVTSSLAFSSALATDLLDGSVSGLIWMHEQPGYNFYAQVSFADISLQVDGSTAPNQVPEPGGLALMGVGLLGIALVRRRSTR